MNPGAGGIPNVVPGGPPKAAPSNTLQERLELTSPGLDRHPHRSSQRQRPSQRQAEPKTLGRRLGSEWLGLWETSPPTAIRRCHLQLV